MSLLPSCREVSRLVSDSLDAGRPLGLHARLHLSICEVCRRVVAQFEALRRAARAVDEAGPRLGDEAKARLRKRLDA